MAASMLEMESVNQAILARREASKGLPPYRAAATAEILALLQSFFDAEKPGARVDNVRRVGGGASKEQFFFTLTSDAGEERYLLRMDPRRAITDTDRGREMVLIDAMQGIVPAPRAAWVDNDAKHFPQSAAIMHVVDGVSKPSGSSIKVTGLGILLGPDLRPKLKDQFLDALVAIHGYDWRAKPLAGFEAPDAHPKQAAEWSLNYWREIWRIDDGETRPVMALADQWLGDNMPDCDDLVLTHGDYRTGNYLFDEATGQITAVLDWELARIGDYHEDLGWVLAQVFGTVDPDDGILRAADLYEREEFIRAYEERSGRKVNRRTLHYYDVMASWKCYVIVGGSGVAAARSHHNHQDVLLTFLAATTPMFADDLVRLLRQKVPA